MRVRQRPCRHVHDQADLTFVAEGDGPQVPGLPRGAPAPSADDTHSLEPKASTEAVVAPGRGLPKYAGSWEKLRRRRL
jgi:hypothetical protein